MNHGLLRTLCLQQSFLWHSVIALLGGLFQTPLYRLHPCRRGFQLSLE